MKVCCSACGWESENIYYSEVDCGFQSPRRAGLVWYGSLHRH